MESNSESGFRVGPELVALQLECETAEQAIRMLADVLVAQGYVKPGYAEAAIERERTCPTGLPTPGIGAAIPHAGLEHTLRPGMAVGTLARPVKFGELGNAKGQIDVSIIFLLSVTDPMAQVYLLQSITQMFRDAAPLRRLYEATDPATVAEQLNAGLERAGSKPVRARQV